MLAQGTMLNVVHRVRVLSTGTTMATFWACVSLVGIGLYVKFTLYNIVGIVGSSKIVL